MTDFVANFDLEQNNLEADFELENAQFDALFQINPAGAAWGSITGQISAQTDLQDALDNKQNTISDLETIRANAEYGASAYSTISNYGDIVSYNAADFATSIQGGLADTAIQPNDNISNLNNDAEYITSSDLTITLSDYTLNSSLATVATSGSYNDLSNKPTIPTVNNAKLTIQKNGTDAGDFTANASVDKIINLQIPTTAADVSALPNSTKYGASIDVSLNTTDYKLTITLKDQDGTTLNYKVVDFPIESVVVNGSYDSTNEKIVLTLQNGNTIDIPVGSLISGLQTEITSTNKLSADLVDDASTTNKFVTASDKTTWNGKQDAISDLLTIRSNATNGQSAYTTISGYGNIVTHNVSEFATSIQGGLADSALQPNDNVSNLVNDAGYITGIDSSDVTTALGFTPADASNLATVATSGDYTDLINTPSIPAAQIQSDWSQSDNTALDFIKNKPSLSNYVTLDGTQNITGTKTFVGQKKIAFKQSSSSDKLGFTLYNNSGTEKGYLEYNPSNTVDSVPLMTLGNYASASGGLTHVGFRKYDGASSSAYNLLTPLASDAKTPFSLSTTYTNFYLPLGFTNGNVTVKTAKTGVVDISTLLPTVPTNISSFTNDAGYITSSALSGYATETWVTNKGYLQNTATGTNALTLLGTATNQSGSINIGYGSSVTNTDSVVIGESAESAYAQTVAIGYQANANDSSSTAIGYGAYTNYSQATAIGASSQATKAGTVAIGASSQATQTQANAFGYSAKATGYGSTALGYNAQASANYSTTLGQGTTTSGVHSIALGASASVTANYSIQIGYGTNNAANTLNVGFYNNNTPSYNWQLLDGTTGLIPDGRISSNIARTSDIPSITVDQTYDGTSANAQSGVAIEGELANYVKADVTDDNTGTQCIIYNNGNSIDCSQFDNDGERGLSVQPYGAKIFYDGSEYNSVEARDSGVSIYCEGSFEFEDSNGYITLSTSNNNLAVNGSEVALQSDLSSLADTDLSNLSATGKTVIDGQWVITADSPITSSTSLNGSTDLEYTLNLPNDNNNYEVIIRAEAQTTTTSGNSFRLEVKSDILTYAAFVCGAQTRSASSVKTNGTVTIPVSSSHKIYITRSSDFKGNVTSMSMIGYRRIGTNT